MAIEKFKQSIILPKHYKLFRAFGTSCYSLSPKGAANLLKRILPLSNISVHFPGLNKLIANNGIDIAMNNEYPEIPAYVSIPAIAFTPNEHHKSTVQSI